MKASGKKDFGGVRLVLVCLSVCRSPGAGFVGFVELTGKGKSAEKLLGVFFGFVYVLTRLGAKFRYEASDILMLYTIFQTS